MRRLWKILASAEPVVGDEGDLAADDANAARSRADRLELEAGDAKLDRPRSVEAARLR